MKKTYSNKFVSGVNGGGRGLLALITPWMLKHIAKMEYAKMVVSIYRYCVNEMSRDQDGWENYSYYQYVKEVRRLTEVKDIDDPDVRKVRFGSARDGGYIMASSLRVF